MNITTLPFTLHIKRIDLITYSSAALFLLILCFDGIISLISGRTYEPGKFNPILSPLILLCLLVIWFLYYGSQRILKVSILFIPTILATLLNLFFTFHSMNFSKGARDLTYLWLLALAYLTFRLMINHRLFDKQKFAQLLTRYGVLLIPIVTYSLQIGYNIEGRFTALVSSAPNFANSMFLLTAIAFFAELRPYWLIASVICSVYFIVDSGTRTALLLIVLLLMYMFLSRQNAIRFGRIIILFAFVGLGLTVYWATDQLTAENRILSINDLASGSLSTRLTIYFTIWRTLAGTGFIGGFGAGVSESLFNYLTHFDFLRYWYDYSLFYTILFVIILYFPAWLKLLSGQHRRLDWQQLKDLVFFTVMVLLLSMHNSFATPFGILAIAILGILIFNKPASSAANKQIT